LPDAGQTAIVGAAAERAAAVAAEPECVEELLVRLVEARTILGNTTRRPIRRPLTLVRAAGLRTIR